MEFRFGKRYKFSLSGEIIIPLMVFLFTLSYYFQVKNLSFKALLFVKPLLFLCFIFSLFLFCKIGIKFFKIRDNSSSVSNFKLLDSTNKISKSIFSNKKTKEVIITFLIALLIIEKLGFTITCFLFIIFLAHVLGEGRMKVLNLILFTITTLLIIYFLFQYWLHVPLPNGTLIRDIISLIV